MTSSRFDFQFGAVLAATVLVLPWLSPGEFVLTLAMLVMIWGIFAVGFDFVFGLLGMVSFGHASFLGIGGYALGVTMQQWGLPFALGVVLAVVLGALCAWLFSFFALRVSGIFFALVTLALSQLLYILADSKLRAWTGGTDGIPGVERPSLAGVDFADPVHFYWYVSGVFALVMVSVAVLRGSPYGRVIAGIRQNETRAEQLGFNVHRYKQITFVVSGAISGLAGALLASLLMYVNPQMLHWTTSGDVIIMTLLGGSGTLWGPVIGVMAFEALKEWMSGWTQHWYGLLGLVFILATLFLPRGIVGELQARHGPRRSKRGERDGDAS